MLTGSYTLTHTESSSQNYSITIPMIEAKSDASKEQYCISLLHRNLECYVHESRQIESGQTGDGKSEHRHFRNQQPKMDWNG